jgi:GxxExxY protein
MEMDDKRRGLCVESQVGIDFTYDGIEFRDGFRLDLLVEKCVILEVKSLERGLAPVHTRQILTYLRLTNLPIGLLLNFGGATMKEGIKRVVNDLPPDSSPGPAKKTRRSSSKNNAKGSSPRSLVVVRVLRAKPKGSTPRRTRPGELMRRRRIISR